MAVRRNAVQVARVAAAARVLGGYVPLGRNASGSFGQVPVACSWPSTSVPPSPIPAIEGSADTSRNRHASRAFLSIPTGSPFSSTLLRAGASLSAPPPTLLARALSTHVGHGSGGRAHSPWVHEPPDTHPFVVKGLNHIALAVPCLKDASEHYRTVFGAQVSDPHPLPKHGVTVVFVHVGSTTIELIEPLGDGSPVAKFLEKHPRGGLHHLCFTVDNIDVAAQHMSDESVRVLGNYSERTSPGDSEAAAATGTGAAGEGSVGARPGEHVAEASVAKPQVGAHGNPVIFLDPRDNLGVLCELEQVFCHDR